MGTTRQIPFNGYLYSQLYVARMNNEKVKMAAYMSGGLALSLKLAVTVAGWE